MHAIAQPVGRCGRNRVGPTPPVVAAVVHGGLDAWRGLSARSGLLHRSGYLATPCA
jgi:hypothetical protein